MPQIECKKFNTVTKNYDTLIKEEISQDDFFLVFLYLNSLKPIGCFYQIVLHTDKGTPAQFKTIHPDPLSYIKSTHRNNGKQNIK